MWSYSLQAEVVMVLIVSPAHMAAHDDHEKLHWGHRSMFCALQPGARQNCGHLAPPRLITREHHAVWLSGKKTSHNSGVGS